MMPEVITLEVGVSITATEAGTSTSTVATASDTASVVSRCAGDQCTTTRSISAPAEASSPNPSSLLHLLLRKRPVSTLLKNVTETSMVEAVYTYVKDSNDKSSLVGALILGRIQPLLEKTAPVIISMIDCLDASIDSTTGRIIDESSKIFNSFATKRNLVKNAVQETIENTKIGLHIRIGVVLTTSRHIASKFRQLRDSLYATVVHQKNSVMEGISDLRHRAEVQAVYQFPPKSVVYAKATINQQLEAVSQNLHRFNGFAHSMWNQVVLLSRNPDRLESRDVQRKEAILERYEAMRLKWASGKTWLENVRTTLFPEIRTIRFDYTVKHLLRETYESFERGCIFSQHRTEEVVGKMVKLGQAILTRIPEKKRELVTEFCVLICSQLRLPVAAEKTPVGSGAIESTLTGWIKRITSTTTVT